MSGIKNAPGLNGLPLLEVKDLKTHFFTPIGVVKAVDGVDFVVQRGEIFGLVGESGCGKSVTALSILRLVKEPGRIVSGSIFYDGISLLDLSEKDMIEIRGRQISMIFQQPQSSLNPVYTIGDQVSEVLKAHASIGRREADKRAEDLLQMVGIPDPKDRMNSYPHEISGGQAQRVMIATALALDPQMLIADEPTTALDVTIQAQVLELIQELTSLRQTSIILITHDLGVIAEMAHRVAVMYGGHIVEMTGVDSLFETPLHPYTNGLIASIPVLGKLKDQLEVIPGSVPNPINLPKACRFAPRCSMRETYQLEICDNHEPNLIEFSDGHFVRCWLYESRESHTAPLG